MDNADSQKKQNLIALFRRSALAMVDELVVRMAAMGYRGIRPAHIRVFENLAPKGSRISELAVRAQMTHQSMSELVVSLEEQGYVEHQADDSDRRAKLICLTPRGREMWGLSLVEIGQIEAAWRSRLEAYGIEGDLSAALEAALRGDKLNR